MSNLSNYDLVLLLTLFFHILQIIYEYRIVLVRFVSRISPNPEKYNNITNGIRIRLEKMAKNLNKLFEKLTVRGEVRFDDMWKKIKFSPAMI